MLEFCEIFCWIETNNLGQYEYYWNSACKSIDSRVAKDVSRLIEGDYFEWLAYPRFHSLWSWSAYVTEILHATISTLMRLKKYNTSLKAISLSDFRSSIPYTPIILTVVSIMCNRDPTCNFYRRSPNFAPLTRGPASCPQIQSVLNLLI